MLTLEPENYLMITCPKIMGARYCPYLDIWAGRAMEWQSQQPEDTAR
jgi:hypothetical protein